MIHIHEHHEYRMRATIAWAAQRDVSSHDENDVRDYFSGYCLDAVLLMPAGSMQRLDSEGCDPFAFTSYSYRHF
ncbi:hypothetical protein [Burkholderia cepacia]|uniref:hypothetical protein n=1 Tax=Burkholderia cepacia TaxID=292 RepID=UPI001F16FE57|nr:hypothetical protein [Burkholderia cepacia]MCE4125798.1 hypothetical protein [Burkholderia cepacia]